MSSHGRPAHETVASNDSTVDVSITSVISGVPSRADIQACVMDAVNEIDVNLVCNVSVRIVDEAEGRALNQEFRGKKHATNVLSFPFGRRPAGLPAELQETLGDVVICGPIVEAEAAAQCKDPAHHWAHLLIHGTLHLLGYDHEREEEAREMEAIESRILARRGIADPYQARPNASL